MLKTVKKGLYCSVKLSISLKGVLLKSKSFYSIGTVAIKFQFFCKIRLCSYLSKRHERNNNPLTGPIVSTEEIAKENSNL